MEFNRAVLVICIVLVLVIGVNAVLFVSLTRRNELGQIDLLRRASHQARDPWGGETNDLQELSRRVADLKSHPAGEGTPEDQEKAD